MPVSEDLMYVCVHLLASVMSNSSRPHGLQPTRLLCPWDSPGKNTGVRCHALLQGIFPTQGPTCISCLAGRFFTTEPLGRPKDYMK